MQLQLQAGGAGRRAAAEAQNSQRERERQQRGSTAQLLRRALYRILAVAALPPRAPDLFLKEADPTRYGCVFWTTWRREFRCEREAHDTHTFYSVGALRMETRRRHCHCPTRPSFLGCWHLPFLCTIFVVTVFSVGCASLPHLCSLATAHWRDHNLPPTFT